MAKQDVIRNIAKGAAYALLGYGVYTLIKKGSVKETAEAIAEVPEKLAEKVEKVVTTTATHTKEAVKDVKSDVVETEKKVKKKVKKFVKGSQEAKDYMASIRAKRKPKAKKVIISTEKEIEDSNDDD